MTALVIHVYRNYKVVVTDIYLEKLVHNRNSYLKHIISVKDHSEY